MNTPTSKASPTVQNITGGRAHVKVCKLGLLVLICHLSFGPVVADSGPVRLVRTPDGGIQPQAAMDNRGVVHLIYFKGDSGGGDIFYVSQKPGQESFSTPIPINSQRGSVLAASTIRNAQLAVGKNGRVHVVWGGMGKGAAKVNIHGKDAIPLLYARLNGTGTAFEPERNVITSAAGLDGGSSVAADLDGNVYVTWHAGGADHKDKEAGRAVFVARSNDEGATFQPEKPAVTKKTGVCPCCGMRAFADSHGAVYILFRAATDMTERGETLLVSRKPGVDFAVAYSDPWKGMTCPMSSATLTESRNGVLAAWETGDNVFFGSVDPKTMQVSRPASPMAGPKRKHPVAVANANGETLFAWLELTGMGQGGSVAWQLFDKAGRATDTKGRAPGVPVWSLVTAFAKQDGSFVIVY